MYVVRSVEEAKKMVSSLADEIIRTPFTDEFGLSNIDSIQEVAEWRDQLVIFLRTRQIKNCGFPVRNWLKGISPTPLDAYEGEIEIETSHETQLLLKKIKSHLHTIEIPLRG